MTPRARRAMLLALLTALVAGSVVALGLPRLRLGPGMPLPSVAGSGTVVFEGEDQGAVAVTVNRVMLAALLVAMGGALLAALVWALRSVRWRALAAAAARALVATTVACGALLVFMLFTPRTGRPALEPQLPPVVESPRTPLGHPPAAVLWLVAAGAVAALGGAAALLARGGPGARRGALDLVGLEAERARAALLAGADALGAIVACYARMAAALTEARGIERPEAMTAREFEGLLGELGLPRGPVHELTRLFEAARYGGRPPTTEQEARAIACLGPIVDACRADRGEG
jgi:hypothetical protein